MEEYVLSMPLLNPTEVLPHCASSSTWKTEWIMAKLLNCNCNDCLHFSLTDISATYYIVARSTCVVFNCAWSCDLRSVISWLSLSLSHWVVPIPIFIAGHHQKVDSKVESVRIHEAKYHHHHHHPHIITIIIIITMRVLYSL